MMQRSGGPQRARKDRLIREHVHDTYKSRRKPKEPTVCPQCSAVYHGGRWQWASRPPEAHEQTCPACHRIRDRYPAGSVSLRGEFFKDHREEVLNVARNEEARAKGEHPLKRIIDIDDQADGVLITTTDTHLARGIGEAVHGAYAGELDFTYVEEGDLLRASWTR